MCNPLEAHSLGKLLNYTKNRTPKACAIATTASVMQHALYVLLFLVLVINSALSQVLWSLHALTLAAVHVLLAHLPTDM